MRLHTARFLFAALAWSCSSDSAGPNIAPAPGPALPSGGTATAIPEATGGATAAPPANGGGPVVQIGGSAGGSSQAGAGPVCAAVRAETGLEPVYLAFAFDVSGSMGKGDEPWHDRALKWEPVVAATRAFLESPTTAGLTASMTFFPADGDEDERCEDEAYAEPDVAMTALPSTEFGAALDAIGQEDWRGGTPTLHVTRGTIAYVEAQRQMRPGKYAMVLVTDGHPQGCDDDEIAELAEIVSGVASELPTYVIGVRNPPIEDAPDTVTNLEQIADAGGTEQAYLIDTGDPNRTADSFRQAIDAIRGSAITCAVDIPEAPDGRSFDKESVVVRYQDAGSTTRFTYDPSCAGESSWHYDDPAAPRQIILCESACNTVSGATIEAELEVEFSCERVLEIPE